MAVTYVTAAFVKANTNNAALAALSDGVVEAKIELAEVYIDAHARHVRKYSDTQTRKFPRQEDVNSAGASFIPESVKLATMAQVEFMYENMPDRDHGIIGDEMPTVETISPRAVVLMRGYRKITGNIIFPEEDAQSVSDML